MGAADDFAHLHREGCFVMPNPPDVGSARALATLGFPALATTSSGLAWTQGVADNEVTLPDLLTHLDAVVGAVDVPVNADFEGGFAREPGQIEANVSQALGTGIAGLSIEDAADHGTSGLRDLGHAVECVEAARRAIDADGAGVVLTGRSEGFVRGEPDLHETIRRLQAYADAGADCLYAPGLTDHDHIQAIVDAVAPKPVNLLVNRPFITVAQAAELGVRRISVGGALARAAWSGLLAAARELREDGTFTSLQDLPDVERHLGLGLD